MISQPTTPAISSSFVIRAERKAYIKAKYEERQFLRPLCNNQHELFNDLEAAIDTHSIYDLLQSVEEAPLHGVDVTDPLPTSVSSFLPLLPDRNM